MHRTPKEILVAKMMEQLAEEPYKNLKFVNLEGRDWKYLSECAEDITFDVHGGGKKESFGGIMGLELVVPSQCFLIFSQKTEKEYLQFLQRYKTCDIVLVHKNQLLYPNCGRWTTQGLDDALTYYPLKEVERFNLEDRLIAVELLNADNEWQIKGHRAFMKYFLAELDSLRK